MSDALQLPKAVEDALRELNQRPRAEASSRLPARW